MGRRRRPDRSPNLVRDHFTRDGKPKRGYPDEAAVLADPVHDAGRQAAYPCRVCGEWHRGAKGSRAVREYRALRQSIAEARAADRAKRRDAR